MLHIKQRYNGANYHIERPLMLSGHLQSQVYMAHYCQFIYTHLSKSVGREGQITVNGSIMERSCYH